MITIRVTQLTDDRWSARFAGAGWKTSFGDSRNEAIGSLLWIYQWRFSDPEGVEFDIHYSDGGRELCGPDGRRQWVKYGGQK